MDDLRRIGEAFGEDSGDWDEDGDGDGVYGFRGWADACTRTSVLLGSNSIPEDPSTYLGLPRSLPIMIRFLQRSRTGSSTLRPHYRLAITLHSLTNPISMLFNRPPSAFSLLSSAIREQPSMEIFFFLDLRRHILLLLLPGVKESQNYTGCVFPLDNSCHR